MVTRNACQNDPNKQPMDKGASQKPPATPPVMFHKNLKLSDFSALHPARQQHCPGLEFQVEAFTCDMITIFDEVGQGLEIEALLVVP